MEPGEPHESVPASSTPDHVVANVPEGTVITQPCGAAAPIVANGATFIGCQLKKGHEGPHSITVKWE